ncbi:hypothetical protein QNI16_36800 [Cytophagaceae bacterium YF14B1]|uniref:Uncharacterized protein n=1 Tax=Xanthocytophaga flava TaxID=3048013 RepID=A0AAE3QZQ5_9BACT|nr:hypothetical protein [Xanthocytophaga flavus]MDJ1486100.1 hypothetical protein [Xanthocytophaga flavus]
MSRPSLITTFQTADYKKKTIWLLGGYAVLLLLSYQLAFKNTWAIYNQAKIMEQKIEQAPLAAAKANELQQKLTHLQTLTTTDVDSTSRGLLMLISNECRENGLILKAFPEQIREQKQDMQILTQQCIVEGRFHSLLTLQHRIEQQKKLGRIVSATYHTRIDYEQQKKVLELILYIQSIQLPK